MQSALTLIPISSVHVKKVTPEMGSPAQVITYRTLSTHPLSLCFHEHCSLYSVVGDENRQGAIQ